MHNKIFTFLVYLFYFISFSPYFSRSVIRFLVFENTLRFIWFERTFLAQRGCWLFLIVESVSAKKTTPKNKKKKKERNGVNVYFALEQLTAAKVNKYIFTTSANRYCYAVDFIYLHDLFFQPQPFFLKLYFNVKE